MICKALPSENDRTIKKTPIYGAQEITCPSYRSNYTYGPSKAPRPGGIYNPHGPYRTAIDPVYHLQAEGSTHPWHNKTSDTQGGLLTS